MRSVLLLALGLLVGCRLAPGPDDGPRFPTRIDPLDPDYLQLGTFNADWLTADLPGDFTLRNEVDLSMMASLITAMDIDLLALQEVDGDEAMDALDLPEPWTWVRGETGWSQNQVLLYRADRVVLTDVREVRLPSNDFPSKDPLVAEVEVLESDLSFTVVALHLNPYVQWSEARYRAEQVRELALWLDGLGPVDPPGGPVAVLGDLNDTLDGLNDELDTLQPLEDRYTFATADTDEYTNVPFRSQIDHLALDDTLEALRHAAGTTEGVQVVRHDRLEPWSLYQGGWDDTQNVSDHRPVYVDLRLPPSRPRTALGQFP